MKNIIIAGTSRAGKSTLAKIISKNYNMSYIPMDSIVSTIEKLYPALGIKHCDDNRLMSKKIGVFLKEYMQHLCYEDINYVIDTYQVYPSDLSNIIEPEKHIAIYLGFLNRNLNEKLLDIRKYERDKDWTKKTSDEDLLRIIKLFISESKEMKKECDENQFPFFDTGLNFDKGILDARMYIDENI